MTAAPDPLADIATLRGGEFMAAVIDEIEQAAITIRRREEIAESRGQQIERDNMRRAALLQSGAEMLTAIRLDGEKSAAAGCAPVNAIVAAVQAGKRAFSEIDQGVEP